MKENKELTLNNLIHIRNNDKYLFTAGPSSLIDKNLLGLRPCFGRGDKDYLNIEESVMKKLKFISGHDNLVRLGLHHYFIIVNFYMEIYFTTGYSEINSFNK